MKVRFNSVRSITLFLIRLTIRKFIAFWKRILNDEKETYKLSQWSSLYELRKQYCLQLCFFFLSWRYSTICIYSCFSMHLDVGPAVSSIWCFHRSSAFHNCAFCDKRNQMQAENVDTFLRHIPVTAI